MYELWGPFGLDTQDVPRIHVTKDFHDENVGVYE